MKTVFIVMSVLTLLSACRRSDKSRPDDSPEQPEQNAHDAPVVSAAPDAAEEEEHFEPLAHGEHYAWGIRLPLGMIPTKAPAENILRFESTHGNAVVRSHIEQQLREGYQMTRSPAVRAYLIGGALPIDAGHGAELLNPGETLSVRVFTGSLGGAAVDVWVISPPAKTAQTPADSSGSSASSGSGRTAIGAASKKSTETQVPRLESPQARRRAFLTVTEKMARGEPLSPEDYNSPYFTEER